MPVLKNPKHERFATAIVAGMNAREAAEEAEIEFVQANGGAPFYVYVLIDPRDWSVFYVGKGRDFRHAAHIAEFRRGNVVNLKKHLLIEEIANSGLCPFELIVQDQMTEAHALEAEMAMIRRIGLARLTNFSAGTPSAAYRDAAWARKRLDYLIPLWFWRILYSPPPKEILLYVRVKYGFWKIANRNPIGYLVVDRKPNARAR